MDVAKNLLAVSVKKLKLCFLKLGFVQTLCDSYVYEHDHGCKYSRYLYYIERMRERKENEKEKKERKKLTTRLMNILYHSQEKEEEVLLFSHNV